MTLPHDSAAPKSALWEDFIDILYAPSRVFARRRDARFGPALLVVAVVGLVLFFAFRGMFDAITDVAITKQVQGDATLTPQQVASARETAAKFGIVTGVLAGGVGYPLLITPRRGAALVRGQDLRRHAAVRPRETIASYANLQRIIGTVVSGVLFALGRPERVTRPTPCS